MLTKPENSAIKKWGRQEMAIEAHERKVKGTLVIALAMIINHRKDIDWVKDGNISEIDLKRVQERILASNWYETDFYERLGSAVFRLVGKSRPEGAYEFGEGIMWQILKRVYGANLLRNDPKDGLARFAGLYNGIFFNTQQAEFKSTPEGGIFKISDPYGFPTQESFVPMIKSLLAKIVRENNVENISVVCEEESQLISKKLNSATYRISWKTK